MTVPLPGGLDGQALKVPFPGGTAVLEWPEDSEVEVVKTALPGASGNSSLRPEKAPNWPKRRVPPSPRRHRKRPTRAYEKKGGGYCPVCRSTRWSHLSLSAAYLRAKIVTAMLSRLLLNYQVFRVLSEPLSGRGYVIAPSKTPQNPSTRLMWGGKGFRLVPPPRASWLMHRST